MKRHRDNEALIVKYLLGALPEAEMERFEQGYLEDETLFEELQEIEDELIDDYVGGALTAEQRDLFEQHFLNSPERSQKLEFARALTEHAVEWQKGQNTDALLPTVVAGQEEVTETKQSKPVESGISRWSRPVPAWRQWVATAAALLIAFGAGALWWRNRELRRELMAADTSAVRAQERAATEHAQVIEKDGQLSDKQDRVQALEEILTQLRAPESRVTLAFSIGVEYLSVGSKGEDERKIKTLGIPEHAKSVSLRVEFKKSEFEKFKATLHSADKTVTWTSGANLKARTDGDRQSLTLSIPPDKLLPGAYDLVISGVTTEGNTESVGKYHLRVVRQ